MSYDNKAAILLSGGVDSAVAALLMKEQHPDGVEGFFMQTGFFSDEIENRARRVAEALGIKLNIIDVSQEFKKRVVEYFENEYRNLQTPNPCAACNKWIKFGVLFDEIRKRGFEMIATGHYIKKVQSSKFKFQINSKYQISNVKYIGKLLATRFGLQAAKDQKKDQSYFLYNLTQEHLKYLEFPLGDLTKDEVWKIARKSNLPVPDGESQDICFLSGDHSKYLAEHLHLKPGPIVDKAGKVIGEHQGLPLYTVGQRRLINIGGTGPYFVLRTDFKSNMLFAADRFDDPDLYGDEFFVENINLVTHNLELITNPDKAILVKIRYLHPAVDVGSIEEIEEGRMRVKLAEKQRAITVGQSAVFYSQEGELLGGGIISS